MSDTSRNFSLRLTAADHLRLEQISARFSLDRTGVLRLLIRRAASSPAKDGYFVTVGRGRARHLHLRLKSGRNDRDSH